MSHFPHIPNDNLFDADVNMLAIQVDNRVYHRIYLTADYAVALLKDGSASATKRAEAVIHAILDCQETKSNDPHYGNFYWEKEEGIVEDLNAVEFVLIRLIPLLYYHDEAIGEELSARMKDAFRIALDEITRIDVALVYTNIVAQDVTNAILGGQLLNDKRHIKRGIKKLRAWQQLIDTNGITHEYNSPVYTSVTIHALSHLIDLAVDAEVKMIAKLIVFRLGVSFALHLHPKTKRLGGPHCRAYYQHLTFQFESEYDTFLRHIDEDQLPKWMTKLLTSRPDTMNIRETSDQYTSTSIGTFHGKSYSLGVATRELDTQSNRYISNQSNVFSVQHTCGDESDIGIVYSRYLVNDRWLGDYRTTLSRGNRDVFFDEGSFRGVQDQSRSLNIYTPQKLGAWERCFSAKACLIWYSNIDEIWINGTDVRELPADIINSDVIVVGSGDIYIAIMPLSFTNLGRHAPIRLIEREEQLVLEMYNYLGPTKTFWELAYPGAFYQGRPKCGFYAEIAEKSEYENGAAFAQAISRGILHEHYDEPATYNGQNERVWTIEYERDGKSLGIELDMMQFEIKRMWTQSSDNLLPMLESPFAIQASHGDLTLGKSRLTCDGDGTRLLIALPESNTWIASYHGPQPSHLRLDVPNGFVEIEQLTYGLIVWENGQVKIDALGLNNTPDVKGAELLLT